jgi:hypothetical protein
VDDEAVLEPLPVAVAADELEEKVRLVLADGTGIIRVEVAVSTLTSPPELYEDAAGISHPL